jgi:hypothetical protein
VVNYASALALVALAAVFLLAGILADSTVAFILAILASAAAVVLLSRRVRARRIKTFVAAPPPRVDPKWSLDSNRDVRDVELPAELEIDHVIDNYRTLVAAEVLPSLETLSVDELRKVINVERHGRNRQAIIHRAVVLIDLTEKPDLAKDTVIDPGAPRARRQSVSATRKSKSAERDPRNTLKKSGPDLTL